MGLFNFISNQWQTMMLFTTLSGVILSFVALVKQQQQIQLIQKQLGGNTPKS